MDLYSVIFWTLTKWFGIFGMLLSMLVFVILFVNFLGYGGKADVPGWVLPLPIFCVFLNWGIYRFGRFSLGD